MVDHPQHQPRSKPAEPISRRRFLRSVALSSGAAILAACGAPSSAPSSGTTASSSATASLAPADAGGETVEVLFTYWGSPAEREAVMAMSEKFVAEYGSIKVSAQHIPNEGYAEKMNTMLAGGTPPDIAYLSEAQAEKWAVEGHLLDMEPLIDADDVRFVPESKMFYGDKLTGLMIAGECALLYYNRDVFDAAQVTQPPSKVADAWTWDEFVAVAKTLTKDRNGNTADSSSFDPQNIDVYGFSFPQWWLGWLPAVYSNNGSLTNDDGTALTLNEPAAVDALQKLQDLIYVHHVSPSPAQTETLPATDVLLQTGKVAMAIDGHWKILDYKDLEMQWSMGVMPSLSNSQTMFLCAPSSISAATKHPEEAYTFFRYMRLPDKVDLFRKGLWMPIIEDYYTDPAKTAAWLDAETGVYPPESRDVLIDFVRGHNVISPTVWLRNQEQIFSEAINPASTALWANELTAQQASDQAVDKAAPLMQGRWRTDM